MLDKLKPSIWDKLFSESLR